MREKLKVHDGDTPGKVIEVKLEYLKPNVATMSRTVCSWCKAPLVFKDDILVCSNTDCPACDEKFLHEELIRTRKALEIALNCLDYICKYIDCDYICGDVVKAKAKETLEQITATLENQNGDC